MTLIPEVKPGQQISQTSGSSKFLNRLIDGINEKPKTIKKRSGRRNFLSANSFLMRLFGDTTRGQVFSGVVDINDEHLAQSQRFIDRAGDSTENIGPQTGLFFVAAENSRDLANWYSHGVFPAPVYFSHWNHRFCGIEGEGLNIAGDGLTTQNRTIRSNCFGGARILAREDAKHNYADEIARTGETSYTVIQSDIDDGEIFGQMGLEDEVPSYRPEKYFIATGTPGAVVWQEAPITCLIERPAYAPEAIAYGQLSDDSLETVASKSARNFALDFDHGNTLNSESNEMLFNVGSGPGVTVRAHFGCVYEMEVIAQVEIVSTPAPGGVTTLRLEAEGVSHSVGADEEISITPDDSAQPRITLRQKFLARMDSTTYGTRTRFRVLQSSGDSAKQASVQLIGAEMYTRPVRRIFGEY